MEGVVDIGSFNSKEWTEFHKKGMAAGCVYAAEHFDELLEATGRSAPKRASNFLRHDEGRKNLSQDSHARVEERLLEFKLLTDFRSKFVDGLWSCLVSRQVPLAARQVDEWGKIDLVGIAQDEMSPCVVELKIEKSPETPLRMFAEAISYACALKKVWPNFHSELKKNGMGPNLPETPSKMPLVLIAPEQYWEEWRRWSSSGSGVPRETRGNFRSLLLVASEKGFPTTFGSITHRNWTNREILPIEIEVVALSHQQLGL